MLGSNVERSVSAMRAPLFEAPASTWYLLRNS